MLVNGVGEAYLDIVATHILRLRRLLRLRLRLVVVRLGVLCCWREEATAR